MLHNTTAHVISPLILVIDDDMVTRHTVSKILKAKGYRTVQAAEGDEGLRAFSQCEPDLVLLDMTMPGMDGVEVCRRIRQSGAREAMPVVMLTGMEDKESIQRSFDVGATDFITKPINWSLLAQRLAYALRGSEMFRQLEHSQLQLREAQRIARMGYWTLDVAKNQVQMTEGANLTLGLPASQNCFALEELLQHVHQDDLDRVVESIGNTIDTSQGYKLEHRLLKADGSEAIVVQQGELRKDKEHPQGQLLGTIQDVTELHQAKAELEYQTYYDPLTDLPNRRSFEAQVAHMLSQAPEDSLFAVTFLGLDRFAQVNDSLSHSGGDRVLQVVADRLREAEAKGHFVSRFGGDVFALLFKDLHHIDDCENLVNQLLYRISDEIEVAGNELYMTASVGVSLFPLESEEGDELIKGAEAAMLRSKEQGGNRMTYRTVEMSAGAQQRLEMEKAMRRGIDNGEFEVFYQPQVDAASGAIIGMEALVRWRDPQRGLIRPDLFIPLAEETGLIIAIGEQVLREACRQTRVWWDMGYSLCVGVNASAKQFAREDFLPTIRSALAESGLPVEGLEIEVTESMAMNDFEASVEKLQALQDMGIKTSMDDFGTGYSSLSYLQQLPLDTLKVDQAFVRCIEGESNCEQGAIASAVIAMSHSLGLHVIAEGVETEFQYQFLKQQGSELLQGYLFGRPMPAEQFESLLATKSKGPIEQTMYESIRPSV